MSKIDSAKATEDLRTSEGVYSQTSPSHFVTLDSKIANAFKKKVSIEEQKAQNENRLLRGKEITFRILRSLQVTGTDGSIGDFSDLMGVTRRGDNVQGVDTMWDEVLVSIERTEDGILDNLYKMRLRDSGKWKSSSALYTQDTVQKGRGTQLYSTSRYGTQLP